MGPSGLHIVWPVRRGLTDARSDESYTLYACVCCGTYETRALKEAEEHAAALLSSLMLFKCLFKDACVHVLLKRQLLEACLTCEQVKLCAVYECLFGLFGCI